MTDILTIKNLSIFDHKSRNTPLLVRDINLQLKPGRPLTLIGETGCGKSLIARSIINLLPLNLQASGQILYQGTDILSLSSTEIRKRWGNYVFLFPQEPSEALNPTRRSFSQVSEIFRYVTSQKRKEAYSRTKTELSKNGLSLSDGKKYPWQLSGGMIQRLMTAITIAEPARLVVVDEPTKGLDMVNKNLSVNLLKEMTDKGKTLFVITHDLDVARQLPGDLAVMYNGEIVEKGQSSDIFERPLHPYTRALYNALPENGLKPIPRSVNGNRLNGGCVFSERCSHSLPECFIAKPQIKGTGHGQRFLKCHLYPES